MIFRSVEGVLGRAGSVAFVMVFLAFLVGCGFETENDSEPVVENVDIDERMAEESSGGEGSWEVRRDPLPAPAAPLRLAVASRLDLSSEEGGPREGRYEFHYHPDGSLWMEGTSSRGDRTTSVEMHWDPPRYRFLRDDRLVAAGEGNPFRAVMDLLPGFETFTLPYLIGLNPLGIDRQDIEREANRWTGPRGRMVIEDGVIRSLDGVPQLLHERYGVFGVSVTYEETVVEVSRPSGAELTEAVITDEQIASVSGEVGSQVPDHPFQTLEGEPRRLSELDKPVLVNVWATWCPPCVHEIPELNDLYQRYKDRVAFVGISSEAARTIREFERDVPIDYRSWRHEGVLPQPFGATPQLPTTYLLDADLRIREIIRGARTGEEFERRIKQSLLSTGSAGS